MTSSNSSSTLDLAAGFSPATMSLTAPVVKPFISRSSQPAPIPLPDSDCVIKSNVSLAPLTSYRVGGLAELYSAPRSLPELQTCYRWAIEQSLPVTVIGAGSNLLISDRGLPGLILCTRHLRHSQFDPNQAQITAAAGEPIVRLAWQAAERGWSGLEWAIGIPGTVGGVVVMNAGAHQGCMADVLAEVDVLNSQGAIETLYLPDLQYRYRSSVLQGSDRLVVQATLQLRPGYDPTALLATTRTYLEQRHTSQPYHLPSCGSVFRNPEPYKAGWLIEQTGLKGYQIGGAQVSDRHANFIVNSGGATADDIFQLIHAVQQQVEQRWSICLEPEVKMLGHF